MLKKIISIIITLLKDLSLLKKYQNYTKYQKIKSELPKHIKISKPKSNTTKITLYVIEKYLDKKYLPKKEIKAIKYITLHNTFELNNLQGESMLNHMYNYFNSNDAQYVSCHYYIMHTGQIYQFVPENLACFHAANHYANNYGFGIECEPIPNDSQRNFSPETRRSLKYLLAKKSLEYKLNLKNAKHVQILDNKIITKSNFNNPIALHGYFALSRRGENGCPKYFLDYPNDFDKFLIEVKNIKQKLDNKKLKIDLIYLKE